MRFIGNVIEKLQRHPKRVVFPEGTEPRVLQAARQFYCLRLGVPILLGDRSRIKHAAAELNVSLEGVRIIDPEKSEDLDSFAHRFELLRRSKGSTLRPLFQIIIVAPQATTASSCMIMEVEDTRFGEQGVMFLADCGVIPEPDVEQLADIAVTTAQLARHMLGIRPRVA